MAETRTRASYGGRMVEGVDVPVAEASEKWSEYQLEDGSILRIKFAVGSVVRLDNEYDVEGNPVYAVKGTTVVALPAVPEKLRKKA